jgi:uncharacterized membrane protein YidH (DUF202 family)
MDREANSQAQGPEAGAGSGAGRLLEKGAPAAAIVAALSTLACCVPLGFLGALGLASLSLRASALRPWLLGAAILLLALGFLQIYSKGAQCRRRSILSVTLFWTAVAVVILVTLFPQLIANWIAG